MCAARNNRLEVVNFLLDNLDRVDLDAVDIDHQTALHHAALGGHIEIVQKLVHVGANPTTVDKVMLFEICIALTYLAKLYYLEANFLQVTAQFQS